METNKKQNKKKKKNNKKVLAFLLVGVFVMAFATAGLIQYFGSVNQDISVEQPIKVNGEEEYTQTFSEELTAGETFVGNWLNISNNGNEKRQLVLNTNSSTGVETSYVGYLQLSTKDVNFSENVWEVTDGEKATVKYTVKDNEFSAEVVEGQKDNYALYYYADNPDRFNNVPKAIPVSELGSESLPYSDDQNAEGGEYDYCETGEYDTCHGAKIWYLPNDAVSEDGTVAWSQADNFLFETKLIQFDSEGNLVVYPNTTTSIKPVYTTDTMLESGDYTVTTTVDLA